MSKIFKSIARELATEAGIEVCRGYMLERLRLVTSKDLYKTIKDGTHTLGVSEEKDRNFGRKWSKVIEKFSYKGERLQREKLTPANVLEWLKQDRSDLASLLLNMGDEGKKWLEQDVQEIFRFLFGETFNSVNKPTSTNEQKMDINGRKYTSRLVLRKIDIGNSPDSGQDTSSSSTQGEQTTSEKTIQSNSS